MNTPVICGRCGSIRVARSRSTVVDRIITLLTTRGPFVCRRCGFRMRRAWKQQYLDATVASRRSFTDVEGATVELDEISRPDPPKEIDLSELDQKLPATELKPLRRSKPPIRRPKARDTSRRRVERGRRREILGGVAVAAIVFVVAIMLSLTGSCGAPPES